MPIPIETLELPSNFELEPEILEQLGSRPGHQRCVEGNGELLLVVHDVPKAGIPERDGIFFWKRHTGVWEQNGGRGLTQLSDLLDRYAKAIDCHEEVIDEADTAVEVFAILRHAGPLMRSSRNLVLALEQVLTIDPDDKQIRNLRDRGREIERAAELLYSDARLTLEFWQAENAEMQNCAAARLNRIAYRLNLLAGFFLPLVALGGLFGMNVKLPDFVQSMFWAIFFTGLTIGGVLLFLVGRKTGKHSNYDSENQ